jgi:hypothetical protein
MISITLPVHVISDLCRVQLPTEFEMAVNLKAAKALGLAVPPSILLRRGDRVNSRALTHGPSGGVADSLDEAAFRAAWKRRRRGVFRVALIDTRFH